MNILDTLRIAWQGLTTNLARSLLTVLGIVIGIIAIILVMSLGASAQQIVINQVEAIGAHTIILRPGRQPQGPTDVAESLLSNSIKDRDVAYLQQPGNIPGVQAVVPAIVLPGTASYQGQVYQPFILGWGAQALGQFFNIYPVEGDFFTDDDIK